MGRSVSYPTGAIVAFQHWNDTCEECDGNGCEDCGERGYYERDWDEEADFQRGHIKQLFPSMSACDEWLGREDHAIAENSFAYFGISEYCGLVALWLVAKPLDWDSAANEAMQDRWLAQVAPRFIKTFGSLEKVGTMSNGEGVYKRIEA